MSLMRKSFTIGNQRGKGNYGKHATPNRFPELSYWPCLQMFSENKDKGAVTPSQHSATPAADPGATPGGEPSVMPTGSKPPDISSLPPQKRYLLTQDTEKLPDLVVGGSGDIELMEMEPLGQDISDTPKENPLSVPGGEDPVVSGLSHTIGSLTVDPSPHLQERIGQLATADVSQFIGQFVQNLTTTPSIQIPLQLPQIVEPKVTATDPTPSTSDLGLRISQVMSLSEPNVVTPTPNIPTARKSTRGQAPPRVRPTYLGPVVTPAHLMPPSDQEKFLSEYIPTLVYQYNLAYEQDDSEEMVKIENLLKAATRTLNQAVKWRDPPPVITENIHEEDVKTHLEFVNHMRESVNNLRYAEPWVAADEDCQLCREYHDLLLEMIPRFESCSTSPNKEHVDKVQEAFHFTGRILEGMIAMNNPSTGTPIQMWPTGEPTPGGVV